MRYTIECDDCFKLIEEDRYFKYTDNHCTCEACMNKKIHWVSNPTDDMKCSECGDMESELSEFEGYLYCEACMDKVLNELRTYIA